jgi:hypothetical protein
MVKDAMIVQKVHLNVTEVHDHLARIAQITNTPAKSTQIVSFANQIPTGRRNVTITAKHVLRGILA